MRRFSLVVGLLLIGFAAPAWADDIVLSPGASINKPTAYGGQGGKGGDGGEGGTGIGVGLGGDGGDASAGAAASSKAKSGSKSEASAPTHIEGDTIEVPASAPSVFGGSLVASPETCLGSFQAGGSGSNGLIGFGLNFGKTYVDPDCTRRMYARSLMLLGGQYNVAAIALLAQDENVAKALRDAGITVPGQHAKAVDTTVPDFKLDTPLGEEKSESTNFGERTSMTIHDALVANLAAQSSGVGM